MCAKLLEIGSKKLCNHVHSWKSRAAWFRDAVLPGPSTAHAHSRIRFIQPWHHMASMAYKPQYIQYIAMFTEKWISPRWNLEGLMAISPALGAIFGATVYGDDGSLAYVHTKIPGRCHPKNYTVLIDKKKYASPYWIHRAFLVGQWLAEISFDILPSGQELLKAYTITWKIARMRYFPQQAAAEEVPPLYS